MKFQFKKLPISADPYLLEFEKRRIRADTPL